MSSRKTKYGDDAEEYIEDDKDMDSFDDLEDITPLEGEVYLESLSTSYLLVSNLGNVINRRKNKKLQINRYHAYTIKGPIITYRYGGRVRDISLINLVYETHVKKQKLTKSDIVEPIDGDYQNVMASNLRAKVFKGKTVSSRSDNEGYSSWMNGDADIFL